MQNTLETKEILITVGKGIEFLHRNGILIGDLNGRNILIDTQKNVYFIDFDGMGVGNILPMFYSNEYVDPISIKNHNITAKDDWYSFAIQAFYYLTNVHPFRGMYKKLNIVQKMEKRISIIGKHRLKIPKIYESWDWINNDLKKAFLDIFEGEKRESIVPLLKKQLKECKKKERHVL